MERDLHPTFPGFSHFPVPDQDSFGLSASLALGLIERSGAQQVAWQDKNYIFLLEGEFAVSL